jgi:hypothetical protein
MTRALTTYQVHNCIITDYVSATSSLGSYLSSIRNYTIMYLVRDRELD